MAFLKEFRNKASAVKSFEAMSNPPSAAANVQGGMDHTPATPSDQSLNQDDEASTHVKHHKRVKKIRTVTNSIPPSTPTPFPTDDSLPPQPVPDNQPPRSISPPKTPSTPVASRSNDAEQQADDEGERPLFDMQRLKTPQTPIHEVISSPKLLSARSTPGPKQVSRPASTADSIHPQSSQRSRSHRSNRSTTPTNLSDEHGPQIMLAPPTPNIRRETPSPTRLTSISINEPDSIPAPSGSSSSYSSESEDDEGMLGSSLNAPLSASQTNIRRLNSEKRALTALSPTHIVLEINPNPRLNRGSPAPLRSLSPSRIKILEKTPEKPLPELSEEVRTEYILLQAC